MAASTTQIKTSAMKKFISTYGGMVPNGEEPDDPLIEIFDDFGSVEDMFAWLAERWVAGGFDNKEGTGTKETKTTKAKKDPNRPKKYNAYMHFTMDHRSAVKADNPGMSNTEVTKELGRIWREDMDAEEKEPYQTASDLQKVAYDEAMASYTPPASDGESEESPKKGRKKKRAEGEPKKALNAYMHFTMAQRSTIKEENPDMKNTEVTKELGRMWREDMSTEEKEPYVQASADDKQRYDLEMESYNPSETPPASTPKKATPKKATKAGAKNTTPKEETKKAATKKAHPKEEKTATKKATPKEEKTATKKKATPKKATPKKATPKKSELEEAYVRFVETESEAAVQEREDGDEEPFTAEEMEEYLVGIWEDLSEEDRLEY